MRRTAKRVTALDSDVHKSEAASHRMLQRFQIPNGCALGVEPRTISVFVE